MCGIAGLVGRHDEAPVVRRMMSMMSHRGPDAEGLWEDVIDEGRTLILGHRRLSIIDLSNAGSQPMEDASGRYVVTYNGEIYNYLELRQELVQSGAAFRSQSDTEVLLEAYRQWGVECLSRLNGMFAFALFDRRTGLLLCARDRFGEKPFLFTLSRQRFAFASEYKALLIVPGIDHAYDELRLIRAAHDPSTGLDADRETVFKDIHQLLPGEAMTIDTRNLERRIWRYWSIAPGNLREGADEHQVFEEFGSLVADSVRLRMRSDVPVGSCLSGGLDSGTIVSVVRKQVHSQGEYHTFTGRFPGTPADEWEYAWAVIADTGVMSHVVEPTPEGFVADLPDFVWHNELPVGSSSQYAQYCVFREAKVQGVTVLLDGQGADELLGGYEQFFRDYVASLEERGEHERLERELPRIRQRYPLALPSALRKWRDRAPFRARHWLSNHFRLGTDLLYGLRHDVARDIGRLSAQRRLAGFHPLGSALYQESFGRYLTTLLRYGDRNSMAHSREVRLPFCDHRLAEFVFALPPHLLMGDAQTKRLLRESMRGVLAESVRARWNKQGFLPPQDLWFHSKPFLSLVRDTFASASFRGSPYWNSRWWCNAVDRLEKGEKSLGWRIWHPFFIEIWKQRFVARISAARLPT